MTGKEYLASKKWGGFHHYLESLQGNVQNKHKPFGKLAWSDPVDLFDVERPAWSLHQMNAGYYFITLKFATLNKRYRIDPVKTIQNEKR